MFWRSKLLSPGGNSVKLIGANIFESVRCVKTEFWTANVSVDLDEKRSVRCNLILRLGLRKYNDG